jgi:general L-amino acid transport system permease protein
MTDTTLLTEIHPVPPPEPPPEPSAGPADWLRRNLFRSWGDAIVTIVSALVVGYILYRLGRYIFVTGRWEIVRLNLKLFMVGRYPDDELWRVSTVMIAIGGYSGLVAGFVHRRHVLAGTEPEREPIARRISDLFSRLWPLIFGTVLLLSLTSTITPTLVVLATVGAALLGRVIGTHLPKASALVLVALGIGGFAVAVWFLTRPVGWDGWGGMMLNLFLAVAGITLCFPLGVLLALGRRSKLPVIRWLSVGYIELFRGVPLYVLLLLGFLALGFFIPTWWDNTPGLVVRAIVVFTLFTAAYVAEIVRGGLQSLPKGQTEAAQALGLSPVRVTAFIVLPQALRNVIPALVGQFISLFKDTVLAAAAMGFLDASKVSDLANAQDAFRGQRLAAETLPFVMLLFWIGCITMSRESQRLERKLGVGTR